MARKNKYLELQGELEKYLSTMTVGSVLPGENDLSVKFKVSRPTLRRALSELVKAGIIEKKQRLGNFVAKSKKAITKELIFLCSNFLSHSITIQTFCEVATERHYTSSILPLNGDRITQSRIIATAMERNPAGIAVQPISDFTDIDGFKVLHDSGIPTVYLLHSPDGLIVNRIDNPAGEAISNIVCKLYQEGFRKFAYYGGPHTIPTTRIRKQGFLDGVKKCRLKISENRISVGGDAKEHMDIFFAQFHRKNRPEVVCCASDGSAARFQEELRKRGIEKGNLMITGFDNNHVMHHFIPDFITAKVDQEKTGKTMAEILIRQVENPEFARRTVKIPPQIIDYRKQ